MNKRLFDVIIVGSGSIGAPTAYYLAKAGFKTLVLDKAASTGQGSNKSAIGGIRATHSDPAKIRLSLRSIDIISHWQECMGDDLEWFQGGYLYPIYSLKDREQFIHLILTQKEMGLDIDWISNDEVQRIAPFLAQKDLLGASYSRKDGNASPLLTNHAFFSHAKKLGASFFFNETVTKIEVGESNTFRITSSKGSYECRFCINAAGAYANEISKMVGICVPVNPDSHEAGITEPVMHFLDPMIVDIRQGPESSNFYFYQHATGQIVFCITPSPNIWGYEIEQTSKFLPQVSRRLINIMPSLSNLRVRRTWRGLYPMTPDGFPIIGESQNLPQGFIQAIGMCGQGFMLGPGVGELLTRLITNDLSGEDKEVLAQLSPDRTFTNEEMLK